MRADQNASRPEKSGVCKALNDLGMRWNDGGAPGGYGLARELAQVHLLALSTEVLFNELGQRIRRRAQEYLHLLAGEVWGSPTLFIQIPDSDPIGGLAQLIGELVTLNACPQH